MISCSNEGLRSFQRVMSFWQWKCNTFIHNYWVLINWSVLTLQVWTLTRLFWLFIRCVSWYKISASHLLGHGTSVYNGKFRGAVTQQFLSLIGSKAVIICFNNLKLKIFHNYFSLPLWKAELNAMYQCIHILTNTSRVTKQVKPY